MRKILALGATGSVGRAAQAVARAHPGRLRLTALSAHGDAEGLAEAAREFGARAVALEDAAAADRLREALRGLPVAVYAGPGASEALASECDADLAVAAISGAAGLKPTLAAVEAGRDIALANKEALVVAGRHFMERIRSKGVRLLPVDSEHSALFQCLEGRRVADARRLVLTASGGPFRGWPADRVRAAAPACALRHPVWAMGRKVTVDSATLANKALEIIEAHFLFNVEYDRIGAVIHPQSLVHGWVEWLDGTVQMQVAPPDMRFPVQYALFHPGRAPSPPDTFAAPPGGAMPAMTFEPLDTRAFPLFGLGVDAGRRGGTWAAAFSGANEAAVAAFLSGALPTVGDLCDAVAAGTAAGGDSGDMLEDALRAEATARRTVSSLAERQNRSDSESREPRAGSRK